MEYNKTLNSFVNYTNKCREKIREMLFTKEDAKGLNLTGKESNSEINEIITKHRLKMIDIKLDHTMRMVEQVIKINENIVFIIVVL